MSIWSVANIKFCNKKGCHFSFKKFVENSDVEYTLKSIKHLENGEDTILQEYELHVCMDGMEAAQYFNDIAKTLVKNSIWHDVNANIRF